MENCAQPMLQLAVLWCAARSWNSGNSSHGVLVAGCVIGSGGQCTGTGPCSGISKYRRWNAWLRENMGESTSGIAVTSARTHRVVERSSRRAPVTVRSIKTPPRKLSLPDVAGGKGRSIVSTVRSSQSTGKGVQRGSEGQKKTSNGTALHVSVRGVRQWPDDGNSWINRTGRGRDGVAARVSQKARLGTGRGSFPRDVEHSRDPPERETSTHSGTIQDVRTRSCSARGCTEHHQTGTHSTQSSSTPQGHRAGRPSTADEQQFRVSSSSAARK